MAFTTTLVVDYVVLAPNGNEIFQSSLSYTQVMETRPGDLPVFLAYRLNGEPLPLLRGGPVRMIVPWASIRKLTGNVATPPQSPLVRRRGLSTG